MKPGPLLILSLCLNMILAATWFSLRRNLTPTPPAVLPISNVSAGTIVSSTNPPAETPEAPRPASPFPWRAIESDDYRQYMANLRAAGCPERLIRDVIVADIDELYLRKCRFGGFNDPPWISADRRRAAERERSARRFALKTEQRAVVKELLGFEWDSGARELWNEVANSALLFGFLPDAKPIQVLGISEEYRQRTAEVQERANFILIDEDRKELKALYDGMMAKLAGTLSPAELEELDLRMRACDFLDHGVSLDGLAISGAELREIARASRVLQDIGDRELFAGAEKLSEEEEARREAAFGEKLKALLGAQRFADYQRAQDDDFRETFEFTRGRSLPETVAGGVFEARRIAEDEARQVREDESLSNDEKNAALAVLKAATAKRIASRLGDAYGDYLEGPGQWLNQLTGSTETTDTGGAR